MTIAARSADEVEAAATEIGATAVVGDVVDHASVERVFDAGTSPDVVINAAAIQGGAGAIGPLWETDPEAFARVIDVNLTGSYIVLRAALRRMRTQGSGSVILFSGGGSVAPRPGFDAYGASKTAVLRLVESAQKALLDEGSKVRVFAIAPGAVSTAMTKEVLSLAEKVPSEAESARKVAAGDGVPPDMAADLCQFMSSDEAAPLAGRLVHVKEPYREYVARSLDEDAGRLRRVNYPRDS